MIGNKLNIIFSDVAAQKITELPIMSQNLIFSFLGEFNNSNIECFKEVQELGNNLYEFKVNNSVNLIFAYENGKILVTDLDYNLRVKVNKAEQILRNYGREIDPKMAYERISNDKDIDILFSSNLIKVNKKAESLNLVFNIVFLIFGIIIGLYLLIAKKMTILPLVIFLTFVFPILHQLIRIRAKTKSSN